jgi:glycosyltransferase involved in cell wall biosynthesis
MKILFLGDASNYHNCLAGALRSLGHDVTVASNGSHWMNTDREINTKRPFDGKVGGALLWANLNTLLRHRLKGYDVVQLSNPVFLDLRPHRVREIFNRLKNDNGSVFLTGLGTDSAYIKMCIDSTHNLRYNEWMIDGVASPFYKQSNSVLHAWLQPPLSDHCDYVYQNVDGVVTALYEYDLAYRRIMPADKVAYAGIPIDTDSVALSVDEKTVPDRVKLFLGMHRDRKVEKGTDRMLAAAHRVKEAYPDKCELRIVENVPYAEYLEQMRNSHVILDQLYSYTPATNALLAMSMGLTAVSGGESDYYDFIGESHNRCVVNALPDDEQLYETLVDVVMHPERVPQMARSNRDFVLKHNDSRVVAQRFVDFWEQKIGKR